MKNLARIATTLLVCASLGACASNPYPDISIETESRASDAANYESYMWAAAAAFVRDPDDDWTPTDLDIGAEITFIVDRELRSKGLNQVAVDPDLLAVYAVGVDMKNMELIADEDNVNRLEEAPKGGVAIMFADPVTRRIVWIGTAEADIMEEPDIELAKKRIDYALTTMLKKFPD